MNENQVNHPKHYNTGGVETLTFIKAKLTQEEYQGFLLGNIIKYISRCNFKGNKKQDLEKSKFYIDELLKEII
jgi:hypothetical protein